MFSVNNNLPRKRTRQEKKTTAQSLSDAQDIILELTEENTKLKAAAASREHEITDLQAQVLSLVEGGAK